MNDQQNGSYSAPLLEDDPQSSPALSPQCLTLAAPPISTADAATYILSWIRGLFHDLNGYITAINGHNDLLKDDLTNPFCIKALKIIKAKIDSIIAIRDTCLYNLFLLDKNELTDKQLNLSLGQDLGSRKSNKHNHITKSGTTLATCIQTRKCICTDPPKAISMQAKFLQWLPTALADIEKSFQAIAIEANTLEPFCLDPNTQESVQTLFQCSDFSTKIIKRFMWLLDGHCLQKRDTNITMLLVEAIHRAGVTKKYTVFFQYSPHLVVPVTPPELIRVFVNLLSNACEAMPNGGLLSVKSQATNVSKKAEIETLIISPGQYVKIEIRDSGPGIKPSLLEKMFQAGTSSKHNNHHTCHGLGLFICSYIIQVLHQGYIIVHSTPMGTCFTIYLPI